MHVTATARFKDYQRNIPATFKNYRRQYDSSANLVGCLHSGLPDFESYTLQSFAKLSHQDDLIVYPFPALTKEALLDLPGFLAVIKGMGFKGCKLHPRLIGSTFSASQLVNIYKCFNQQGLCLMLCTLCLGGGMSNIHHLNYLRFLEKSAGLSDRRSKIILAHGGASWFMDYFEFAQYTDYVLLDLSFTLARYSAVYLDQFLYAIGLNKKCVAFGTDWPDYTLSDCLKPLSPILDDRLLSDALKNFLAGNALEFLGGI